MGASSAPSRQNCEERERMPLQGEEAALPSSPSPTRGPGEDSHQPL